MNRAVKKILDNGAVKISGIFGPSSGTLYKRFGEVSGTDIVARKKSS